MEKLDQKTLLERASLGQGPLKSYLSSQVISYNVQEEEGTPTEITFEDGGISYAFMFDGDMLMATSPAL